MQQEYTHKPLQHYTHNTTHTHLCNTTHTTLHTHTFATLHTTLHTHNTTHTTQHYTQHYTHNTTHTTLHTQHTHTFATQHTTLHTQHYTHTHTFATLHTYTHTFATLHTYTHTFATLHIQYTHTSITHNGMHPNRLPTRTSKRSCARHSETIRLCGRVLLIFIMRTMAASICNNIGLTQQHTTRLQIGGQNSTCQKLLSFLQAQREGCQEYLIWSNKVKFCVIWVYLNNIKLSHILTHWSYIYWVV